MTLYEVELRVQYGRKVLIEAGDEDSASEMADYEEVAHLMARPGSFRVDTYHQGIRTVTKEEMEDA